MPAMVNDSDVDTRTEVDVRVEITASALAEQVSDIRKGWKRLLWCSCINYRLRWR